MKRTMISLCLIGSLAAGMARVDVSALDYVVENAAEVPVASPLSDKIIATIKKLPDEGAAIEGIDLVNGIRAMDGEIATPGEVKVLVNFNWLALGTKTTHRQALDNASARIVAAVFSEHAEVTKLRVIVKTLNNRGAYQASAKVFSFTRAMWELAKSNPRYHVRTADGVMSLLRLGDYVILTDRGWMRGY